MKHRAMNKFLSAGLILFAAGTILDRVARGYGWGDFIAGFCIGLSVVLMTAYLVTTARQRRGTQ